MKLPKIVLNHYLDSDEWFLVSSRNVHIEEVEIIDRKIEEDFETKDVKFKVTVRFKTREALKKFEESLMEEVA